ncbi:hypothetical protein ACFYQA_18070 [Streptomyces sp. NPDC005774]|uniref:hypothetical protein n=1 Tax=Streptomyces sp. NPDC005774 TaxID=3364728 RepID=UPI0036C36FC9
MKIVSYGLLAISLIALVGASGMMITSGAGSARSRSARKALIVIAVFAALGIAGVLLA